MTKSASNVKEQAHELIDQLPDDVTWDDVVYHFRVRGSIERGLADAEAGRVITTEELRSSLNQD